MNEAAYMDPVLQQEDCEELTDIDDRIDAGDLEKIHDLFKETTNKSIPVLSAADSKELVKLEKCLENFKALLAQVSPTAKLWLQYIEYIETLKLFILSERTANWNLHLIAVGKMLNLFAATGYVCCNRVY